jgi:signal transduction histidine kinase
MRNTIAKDLHDEVGANLSNIALFIAVLKQKMNESTTESIPLIDKINQFAQSSQDSMTDIVWMINSNNDEFENLTIKMKDYTSLIAEDSPIQINYQLDHSLSKIKLDMLSRKNIYLFFKEALNNAIKHSNATKIDIITKWTGNELHLQIIDNGKGFDNTQTYKGNGLKNLEKRAEQLDGQLIINSTSSAGTSIELICSPLSNKVTH